MDNLTTDATSTLVNLSVECWRFARSYARAVDKLDANERSRFLSQHRYFLKQVEDAMQPLGLKLVNLEGQRYEPGLAVTAINLEEFPNTDELYIAQTLEPIIMGPAGIVRAGSVVLAKVKQ